MDYRTVAQIDISDPKELRRYEDRLSKRLQRFGYCLSKGATISAVRKIALKREPVKKGYKITNTSTGAVELGERYDLTLEQVEEFWQRKNNEWQREKMNARAERQKAEVKKAGKSLFAW